MGPRLHSKDFFFLVFCLFRAAPAACGGSQARGQIGAVAADLHYSHSNTGSLTHWSRPGIKPSTSWFLVGFVSAEPWQELQQSKDLNLSSLVLVSILRGFPYAKKKRTEVLTSQVKLLQGVFFIKCDLVWVMFLEFLCNFLSLSFCIS